MKTRVLSVGCWIPTLAVLMALGMMVAPKSSSVVVDAFILPSSLPTTSTSIATTVITTTRLYETTGNNEQGSQSKKSYKKKSPKKITIADLRKELLKNPQQMEAPQKQKARRTRRRSEQPQQTYTYAAQRKNETPTKKDPLGGDGDEIEESSSSSASTAPGVGSSRRDEFMPLVQARELGLVNAAMQHCDPLVDGAEPRILGRVRVGESGSEEYAYVINKPAGWSIIGSAKSGGGPKQASTSSSTSSDESSSTKPKPKASTKQRIKIKSKSGKGKDEFLEFDEADVLALLTPEERAEWEEQGELEFQGPAYEDDVQDPAAVDIPGWYEVAQMSSEERDEACIEDEDFDPEDIPDFNEADILALMSPEEIEDYEQEKIASKLQQNISKQSGVKSKKNKCNNPLQRYLDMPRDEMDPNMLENLKRIERRLEQQSRKASFSTAARPSVVSWLKELKASEGTPIRGGKFWTAVAGATEVDDSGAVVLCPKAQTENLFVDAAEYVTVVGNGEFLAPPPKRKESTVDIPTDLMEMDIVSKVRKGRDGDTCQTVRVIISETASSCASIIPHVQAQFADGIRGDPAANPFDRRAPRRLIHCQSLTVSSLSYDEDVQAELEDLPDDIAILAERLNRHKYAKGSFLGRSGIRKNPLTNTYREINGAADGFPGWTVDRYADWLFVQHDPKEYRGPLPSIHDGSTTGVYYLSANPDRGSMGSDSSIRPTLLEGKAAPDIVPILENGVTYHVSLDKDLSTGMFLDQRPQRAWLTRNCHEDTHVLNCFAHCGAFSVAAAAAGASTVSLDLNKKWLERVQPQLEANDIVFDERHDCIFGDCFEWLQKLSKRGEKFDIVILDPPSSSVGKKKRRWSVKNDMDELVALAAPLVKEGGLLWTTTNSAGLSPIKFARLCKRGLESVGLENAKLERIQPMPVDFPSIGAQPVKNLVWRIP